MKKVSDYRKDNRTINEFESDIKYGNVAERDIMEKYAEIYQKQTGKKLEYEDNGCGNDGELLSEEEVTLDADYKVSGRNLEIKFNNNHCKTFHIKQSQIKSYIKQKSQILWVNGYKQKDPVYTILSLDKMKMITKKSKLVEFEGWGGKKAFQLKSDDFNWKDFK